MHFVSLFLKCILVYQTEYVGGKTHQRALFDAEFAGKYYKLEFVWKMEQEDVPVNAIFMIQKVDATLDKDFVLVAKLKKDHEQALRVLVEYK